MEPITMTADQILNRFPEINPMETSLCDLDDSEFVTGGRITEIVRGCGYDESGRVCINQQNAWSMSLYDWAHTMGI